MEETISLKDIFRTLRKRVTMIVLITLAAVAISAVATYFIMTPKYEASTQILVNQSSKSQTPYDVNAVRTNVEYINTYSVIIKSPTILKSVIDKLGLNMTTDQLKESLTVNSAQDSQVFTVSVQNTNPAQAVKIANGIATVFKNTIPTIMKVDNVSILSKAQLPDNPSPVSPKPMLNMAIAFVVGLMIAIGLAFLLEYLDNTIKTEEDIETVLELPVLGAVMEADLDKVRVVRRSRAEGPVRGEHLEA
ncbi:YveK family protein [Camelliibacillus cellulosilyticus]|uniref:YveK family protein n=1 Tax=Camelliibacillus cellulosilyticus TaxID=2174486 RepID=A0ABV9GQC4_9BACL